MEKRRHSKLVSTVISATSWCVKKRSKERTKCEKSDKEKEDESAIEREDLSISQDVTFINKGISDLWIVSERNCLPPPVPPRKPLVKGRGNLFSSISELLQKNVPWYWGPLTVKEAERLLSGRTYGCFLMRDSASLNNLFSITVQVNRDHPVNIRIEYVNGEFRLMANDFGYDSVVGLVNKTLESMERGNFCFLRQGRPGVVPKAITLLSYVSRHEVVPSLKYLSRMKLRQVLGSSHCDHLFLPPTLSDYFKRCPFYDSDLIEAVIQNYTELNKAPLTIS